VKEFDGVCQKLLGVPRYLASFLYNKIDAKAAAITKATFLKYWKAELQGKSPKEAAFHCLKKPTANHIEPEDLKPLMKSTLHSLTLFDHAMRSTAGDTSRPRIPAEYTGVSGSLQYS
jgi:uncharacterized protein Usg